MNWSERYDNEEEEKPFWHPFNSEDDYYAAAEAHAEEQDRKEQRQKTHDENHRFYIDNFARRGLKDTDEAREFYRTKVVPYKNN